MELLCAFISKACLLDKATRYNERLKNSLHYNQSCFSSQKEGAFRSASIASDISAYGTPIGVVVKAPANNNPAHACLVGTNLNAYSATAGTVVVYVTYNAFSNATTPWT